MKSKLLNTREVATVLGYTIRNILHMVNSVKIKPINPYHKQGFLFTQSEIKKHKPKNKISWETVKLREKTS
jgi:hypothetical protein